jgi:hypothetical protein
MKLFPTQIPVPAGNTGKRSVAAGRDGSGTQGLPVFTGQELEGYRNMASGTGFPVDSPTLARSCKFYSSNQNFWSRNHSTEVSKRHGDTRTHTV